MMAIRLLQEQSMIKEIGRIRLSHHMEGVLKTYSIDIASPEKIYIKRLWKE
jgi:hypothetical protein